MNYCVLIQLSRNSISFWCQQQGAPFEPLAKKEGNVLPLYFYVNGNDFMVGKFAQEKYLNGDTVHAFGDYFSIVTDPSKYFTIFGNQKHVKFLLYFAIELYLSHFLNTVLYKNDSIEEYRSQFPLRFMFSSDILQKERLLVESIFIESGYDNIDSVNYYEFLFTNLLVQNIINRNSPIILLSGIDGNLFIELFIDDFNKPSDQEIVEDQGADPRIKLMAKLLLEKALSITHISLNEKEEIIHLLPFAKEFLDMKSAIPRGDIVLSDGTICYVQLKKKELDERLIYYSGEDKVFRTMETMLRKNEIHDNQIQVVLNGKAINTSYFIERLKKRFSHVIGTPLNSDSEVLKLAFKSIADTGYRTSNCYQKFTHPTESFPSPPPPLPSTIPLRNTPPQLPPLPHVKDAPLPPPKPPVKVAVPIPPPKPPVKIVPPPPYPKTIGSAPLQAPLTVIPPKPVMTPLSPPPSSKIGVKSPVPPPPPPPKK